MSIYTILLLWFQTNVVWLTLWGMAVVSAGACRVMLWWSERYG